MKFEKPAVSVPDQVELLKRRGMIVGDEAQAQHYLNFISYYRLRAYWLPFEVPAANNGDHAFRGGTTFEDVLTLYIFDRELQLLVLDAIERVEVALRAQWAHHMAMSHGPHGYLEEGHYAHIGRHADAVAELKKEFTRSRDTFATHYRDKYTSPTLPPVWMAAEVMSFGLLSKFYSDLKMRSDRNAIAAPFALDEKVVTSFAHHISHIRNICAHHDRLWNKRFTVKMTVPKYPAKLPVAMRDADPRYLHNTLVMLDYLCEHSAGSGKTSTIAWTAHDLVKLRRDDGTPIFDTVIIVTDRNVLEAHRPSRRASPPPPVSPRRHRRRDAGQPDGFARLRSGLAR